MRGRESPGLWRVFDTDSRSENEVRCHRLLVKKDVRIVMLYCFDDALQTITPIGATDFDDLAASDSDAEESDDTLPSRTDDFLDNLGGSGHCTDTILMGAGLTVY